MPDSHHSRNVSLDRRAEAHLESKPEFSHEVWNSETQLCARLDVASAAGDLILPGL